MHIYLYKAVCGWGSRLVCMQVDKYMMTFNSLRVRLRIFQFFPNRCNGHKHSRSYSLQVMMKTCTYTNIPSYGKSLMLRMYQWSNPSLTWITLRTPLKFVLTHYACQYLFYFAKNVLLMVLHIKMQLRIKLCCAFIDGFW